MEVYGSMFEFATLHSLPIVHKYTINFVYFVEKYY